MDTRACCSLQPCYIQRMICLTSVKRGQNSYRDGLGSKQTRLDCSGKQQTLTMFNLSISASYRLSNVFTCNEEGKNYVNDKGYIVDGKKSESGFIL